MLIPDDRSVVINSIISDFAFSESYAPTIFCTDEFFEYVRTENHMGWSYVDCLWHNLGLQLPLRLLSEYC